MSSSSHQIQLKGVDKTGAAFQSVKDKAAATGAQIRSMLGGALAAAGAYLGFRSIKGGIDELGHLSDVAMKTSTSVDELTQAATAMSVLGIQNMGVDQLAKSFDYMAKATGRTGLEGFYQTIEELGKIPDLSERSQEAMKVFGRSGMEFMPLVNAAKNGTAALRSVIETMPAVSQAAANVGDALSDAKTIGAEGFKSLWLNAIGAVCNKFDLDFRGGAKAMIASVKYGARVAWRYLNALFQANDQGVTRFKESWDAIKTAIMRAVVIAGVSCIEYVKTLPDRIGAGFVGGITGLPGIFSKSYREKHESEMRGMLSDISQKMWANIDRELKAYGIDATKDSLKKDIGDIFGDVKTDDLKAEYREALKMAKRLGEVVDDAANSVTGGGGSSGNLPPLPNKPKGGGSDLFFKSPEIRNDLITSVHEANRIALLGPQLQNESKKQTKILEDIRSELGRFHEDERTAENDFEFLN